jgi:ABC-type sugar transport system substrate-binding protein
MEMRRFLTVFIGIFLFSAALFAGGKSENAGKGAKGKELTLILKNFTNPFFIRMKEGAEKAAAEEGVKLTVVAPLKADNNEEQMQMVEQAIARQTDALIIVPSDSQGIVPAVEKAYDAGIPIINLNTKIGGDRVIWKTFVGVSNFDEGIIQMQKLCELIGGEGGIFIIEGTPGAQTAIDILNGGLESLKKFPKVKILGQQAANYNRAKSMDVVQNLLQAHPEVKAIFCCNDEMALGAVEAVQAANLQGIFIAGINANDDARQAIRSGRMAFSINDRPDQVGYEGVKAAVKVLNGETIPDRITVQTLLVTGDDA